MARSKKVSPTEELETLSAKVKRATKEKVERIAARLGLKPGVWLRDHLDNLKE